ncbi:glutathione S-transferase [Tranquillimonas alkanivorans]|uniref:Glutathione S-transferase n=1 Tax=Tranquillimonas alkanivorans TaxID=441119 RepID=A0A1I5PMX3_9RHOB|nr:glutathione S-transferase [Tranquillimonas alkanivorans]SFP34876.1 Glutathione S-transferase [Tranquillimonas alkanivorans]
MLRLHHSAASPFVRKVMVLLHETGQVADVEIVPANVGPLKTGDPTLSHNPLGKIPTLTRDDGPALYDSRVICRYLDARTQAGLYPEARLWEALTLEATADGIMDAIVLIVTEGRVRDEAMRSQPWIEAQYLKATRALDVIEDRWMSHLSGRLDIGQIGVGCALGYLDLRTSDRDWRAAHPALARWYARFAERPSMLATAPPVS